MAKNLEKAQMGNIVKSAAKVIKGEKPVIKSVGRTTTIQYHPQKEFHGPAGRIKAKQYKKDDIAYKVGVGTALGAGAAGGAAMAKKTGGAVKTKTKTKK